MIKIIVSTKPATEIVVRLRQKTFIKKSGGESGNYGRDTEYSLLGGPLVDDERRDKCISSYCDPL
jgi:hypothetical protein